MLTGWWHGWLLQLFNRGFTLEAEAISSPTFAVYGPNIIASPPAIRLLAVQAKLALRQGTSKLLERAFVGI